MQLRLCGCGIFLSLLFQVAADSSFVEINLAYGKIARSNSPLRDIAERAVDHYTWDTCATVNTGDDEVPAWWQVDLGSKCVIDRVMIVGPTADDYKYLSFFDITVSDGNKTSSFSKEETCFEQRDPGAVASEVVLRLQCLQPLIGQFVTIRRQLKLGPLPGLITLCDVRVIGVSSAEQGVGNK